jgi:hypothetical protein
MIEFNGNPEGNTLLESDKRVRFLGRKYSTAIKGSSQCLFCKAPVWSSVWSSTFRLLLFGKLKLEL